MTLKEAAIDRKNNLNIIRLVASLMVLYMHSFAICIGDQTQDVFGIMTFGKELAGGIAVDIFFIISGFLIFRSYARTNNPFKYFKARFLRIWPLLFVVIMVTAFIVGPIISRYSRAEYFAGDIGGFLLNIFFISSNTTLPGVFNYHYNHSLNGSLWTLQFEVLCYIAVALFSPVWKRFKQAGVISFILLAILYVVHTALGGFSLTFVSDSFLANLFRLSMFFAMGGCYYLYQDVIKLSLKYVLITFVCLAIGVYLTDFSVIFALFGSYIIFYIAFQKRFIATWYDKIGDLSYGIYIMSFPVQQIVCEYMGSPSEYYKTMTMNPYLNMVVSLLIVVALAYISWHLLEKQCLKLK